MQVRLPQIPATKASYENKIKKHIRPAFEKLRMCDIDKPTIEAWLNAKQTAAYSHNTLLDLRKVLSAVFSQAEEWKLWQGENPCWHLKNKIGGPKEVFRKVLPKPDGLMRFLGALEENTVIPVDGAKSLP